LKTNKANSKRGIALIIVMVVILALSAIVGGFAYSMKVEMRLAMNSNYDSELEWIGRGGVEWAKWAIGGKRQPYDSLNQFWSLGRSPNPDDGMSGEFKKDVNDIFEGYSLTDIPFGENAKATVTITDMERKWNINALAGPTRPQVMLVRRALDNMGLTDATLEDTITDSIMDWIDPSEHHHMNGAKSDYYLHLDPPYYCKQGYIDDISELLLVKGIRENPEIYYGTAPGNLSFYDIRDPNVFNRGKERPSYTFGLKDVFTVMGTGMEGRININTASSTVLQMIPGVDERGAQAIIRARSGPDSQDGTDDDTPFQGSTINANNIPGLGPVQLQNYCIAASKYFEVKVDAEINGYKRTFHAVIDRSGAKGPLVVKFYWDEAANRGTTEKGSVSEP
jgi:type II secretory pathway component PulK